MWIFLGFAFRTVKRCITPSSLDGIQEMAVPG
jgi:hypothetical protein